MNDHCPRIDRVCLLATYREDEIHCGANASAYSRFINNKGFLLARNISEKVDCAVERNAKRATKDIRESGRIKND